MRTLEERLKVHHSISREKANYVRVHEMEEHCNREFNLFVRNYQKAYEGVNTTSHQLNRRLGFKGDPGEGIPSYSKSALCIHITSWLSVHSIQWRIFSRG